MSSNQGAALSQVSDYRQILVADRPVIDVRSPLEFAQGAVPSACNLPILNDDERAEIGKRYKSKGQLAAYELGMALVSDSVRASRIRRWHQFIDTNADPVLCCWRGGLRSNIAQSWLCDSGYNLPVVQGGSKALRSFCLSELERASGLPLMVVSGRTGVGKTALLHRVAYSIDLEALAKHRGSAFGKLEQEQPHPVSFDALLVRSILRSDWSHRVVVEDESRNIGRLTIPAGFYRAMQNAPIVVVCIPDHERITATYCRYVKNANADRMLDALGHIRKRLGGVLHARLRRLMAEAFRMNDVEQHRNWIALLLKLYYDVMYDYQLSQKEARVVFRGNHSETLEWLGDPANLKVVKRK